MPQIVQLSNPLKTPDKKIVSSKNLIDHQLCQMIFVGVGNFSYKPMRPQPFQDSGNGSIAFMEV